MRLLFHSFYLIAASMLVASMAVPMEVAALVKRQDTTSLATTTSSIPSTSQSSIPTTSPSATSSGISSSTSSSPTAEPTMERGVDNTPAGFFHNRAAVLVLSCTLGGIGFIVLVIGTWINFRRRHFSWNQKRQEDDEPTWITFTDPNHNNESSESLSKKKKKSEVPSVRVELADSDHEDDHDDDVREVVVREDVPNKRASTYSSVGQDSLRPSFVEDARIAQNYILSTESFSSVAPSPFPTAMLMGKTGVIGGGEPLTYSSRSHKPLKSSHYITTTTRMKMAQEGAP